MSDKILDEIYENNKTNYSSGAMFLYCEPLMGRVLKYYTEKDGIYSDTIAGKIQKIPIKKKVSLNWNFV